MRDQPTISLHDGREIPQLGFGTWQIPNDEAAEAVRTAIEVGYDHIDTAAIYENEEGVSNGITNGIFFTTKIWNDDQGYDATMEAFGHALNRTGREDVDLLLIHWPCPEKDLYVETWQALIDLNKEGRAKSIGVSNFAEEHLRRIIDETGYAPVVNQIELHPSFQQRDMRAVHEELGIATESWSPLGQGGGFDNETIRGIAEEIGQSPAAVTLRWHLQHGLIAIPKASSREHMADNFSALSFELSDAQMDAIDALDDPGGRIGPPPEDVN